MLTQTLYSTIYNTFLTLACGLLGTLIICGLLLAFALWRTLRAQTRHHYTEAAYYRQLEAEHIAEAQVITERTVALDFDTHTRQALHAARAEEQP